MIVVTDEDIRLGIQCAARECPLARAIARYTSHPVLVGTKTVTIHNSRNGNYYIELPQKAVEFRRKFDYQGGRKVRPFAFHLDIPKRYR